MSKKCCLLPDLVIALIDSQTEEEAFNKTLGCFKRVKYILWAGIYTFENLNGNLTLIQESKSKNKIPSVLKELKKGSVEYKYAHQETSIVLNNKEEKNAKTGTFVKYYRPIKFKDQIFGCLIFVVDEEKEIKEQEWLLLNGIPLQIAATLSHMHLQKEKMQKSKVRTPNKFVIQKEFRRTDSENNPRQSYNETVCPLPLSNFPTNSKYKTMREIKIDNNSVKRYPETDLKNIEGCWLFNLISDDDGIWEWDLTNNTVYFSSQFGKLFGYNCDDIKQKLDSWHLFVHPDDFEEVNKILSQYISGEASIYKAEYRILCKNGSYKWILERGRIAKTDSNGKPVRMLGFFTDISNRKIYESSLLESLEREKELNKTKTQLMSLTSHELKSPLAVIYTTAESLETYFDKMSKDERLHKIKKIKKYVKSLTDAFNWAKEPTIHETGELNYKPTSINLVSYVEDIINEYKEEKETKHQIEFYSSERKITIKIDTMLIKHLISNLLSNAIKYSPKEFPVRIALKKQEDYVDILVSDKGIGIPEKELDLIFTPFSRGSNVGEIKGTGLGLSLSQKILKIHKGNISIHSIENQGTLFTISLPLKQNLPETKKDCL